MMCSKKCANPVFPGSTSFRDPACTGIWIETMFGNPVGTTMMRSPLGSVVSDALKGRTSEAVARTGATCFVAGAWAVEAAGKTATAVRSVTAARRVFVMGASTWGVDRPDSAGLYATAAAGRAPPDEVFENCE